MRFSVLNFSLLPFSLIAIHLLVYLKTNEFYYFDKMAIKLFKLSTMTWKNFHLSSSIQKSVGNCWTFSGISSYAKFFDKLPKTFSQKNQFCSSFSQFSPKWRSSITSTRRVIKEKFSLYFSTQSYLKKLSSFFIFKNDTIYDWHKSEARLRHKCPRKFGHSLMINEENRKKENKCP